MSTYGICPNHPEFGEVGLSGCAACVGEMVRGYEFGVSNAKSSQGVDCENGHRFSIDMGPGVRGIRTTCPTCGAGIRRKPTVAELEAILSSKEPLTVNILPDGSITAETADQTAERWRPTGAGRSTHQRNTGRVHPQRPGAPRAESYEASAAGQAVAAEVRAWAADVSRRRR